MAKFPNLTLTENGLQMLVQAQSGHKLLFTCGKLGSGVLTDSDDIRKFTDLKAPKMTLPITKTNTEGTENIKLTFDASNTTLEEGFISRELGIFAKLDDNEEKLYAYSNAGNNYDYMPNKDTPSDENRIVVELFVSNDADIKAEIDPSIVYPRFVDVEEMIAAHNADDETHIISPTNRNGIYRGKDLGVTISTPSEMQAFLDAHEVSSGKFTGLYLGDMIIIRDGTYNVKWLIVGFDTELHRGDTDFATHHLSLLPVDALGTSYMNSTNTSAGGYQGSYMWKTTIPKVVTSLNKALGTHLLTRRVLLSNSMNANAASGAGAGWNGCATDWSWVDARAVQMSEVQVYGSVIGSSSIYDVGEACEKLPVFNFKNHVHLLGRSWFWLRAVAGAAGFASAGGYGSAHSYGASDVGDVRPLICVG